MVKGSNRHRIQIGMQLPLELAARLDREVARRIAAQAGTENAPVLPSRSSVMQEFLDACLPPLECPIEASRFGDATK